MSAASEQTQSDAVPQLSTTAAPRTRLRPGIVVLVIAATLYLGSIKSPPSLMDDVDAAHAQIARSMLATGDWVTQRLDGVAYFDKAPFHFWLIALSYSIFGVHDWAARIPLALSAICLSWITYRFGRWAFSERAGMYAGCILATSVGLFLFTRVLIPDAILTLAITVALWSFLRVLDENEKRPQLWSFVFAASLGLGLLIKGLLSLVVPIGTALVYLAITHQLFKRATWRKIHPFTGLLIIVGIAAPWHIAAILQNPPYLDFTIHSGPHDYRGFFWRYFINEHLLRYLNLRYPRDYDTVPRAAFWLLNVVWLFPWTVFLGSVFRLSYQPVTRAGRTRLLALVWIGFLLVFFTFSTTQEYYSMPIYPAVALMLGCGISQGGRSVQIGNRLLAGVCVCGLACLITLLILSWNQPTPGDLSNALSSNPGDYTLSLGHLHDLSLRAFAYLRWPIAAAAASMAVGIVATTLLRRESALLGIAAMMLILTQAARSAMIAFDPVLSSRALASAVGNMPGGQLIFNDEYYAFSSVAFYLNQPVLLLHGRFNNLEYGSYAPGAPHVFLDESSFTRLWLSGDRFYLFTLPPGIPVLESLVGKGTLHMVAQSGGKYLITNKGIQ